MHDRLRLFFKTYWPLTKPILWRGLLLSILFVGLAAFFVFLPRQAVRDTSLQFETFLTKRSTVLAQSRILTFDLIRKGTNDDDRARLVSYLHTLFEKQQTLLEQSAPRPSRWLWLRYSSTDRDMLLETLPQRIAETTTRHDQFLTAQRTWLDTLEHTQPKNIRAFLTSSSSISLLTEQTNLLLQYQFWSKASADRR